MTIKTTTLVESDVEHPSLLGEGTSTQSTRVEITTEGGGIETIQETALAAAATYRTAVDDDLVKADVIDDPEPLAEVPTNDVDVSGGVPRYEPAGSWEGGTRPFSRVVEILGEVDLGASPEQIARAINTAGIYFIQRKEG